MISNGWHSRISSSRTISNKVSNKMGCRGWVGGGPSGYGTPFHLVGRGQRISPCAVGMLQWSGVKASRYSTHIRVIWWVGT